MQSTANLSVIYTRTKTPWKTSVIKFLKQVQFKFRVGNKYFSYDTVAPSSELKILEDPILKAIKLFWEVVKTTRVLRRYEHFSKSSFEKYLQILVDKFKKVTKKVSSYFVAVTLLVSQISYFDSLTHYPRRLARFILPAKRDNVIGNIDLIL